MAGYHLAWKRILLLKTVQEQLNSNNILKLVLGEQCYKNESFSQRSFGKSVVGLSLRHAPCEVHGSPEPYVVQGARKNAKQFLLKTSNLRPLSRGLKFYRLQVSRL